MKSNIYKIILGILFPVLFVTFFLMFAGTDHGVTCWVGLGFVLFSYCFMMFAPLLTPVSKSTHLFSVTGSSLTSIYFVINLIVGIVFMIWDFEQWKYAVVVEVLLLTVFLVLFLPVLISDETTANKENAQKQDIYAIKTLVTKVKIISGKTTDLEKKKQILKLYDEINSCPSTSNSAVKSIDESIGIGLEKLEIAVFENNNEDFDELIVELMTLTKERKEFSRY